MSTNKNMITATTIYKSKRVDLLYPDLSYILVGLCFDTHKEKGGFAREKQYADAFEEKLRNVGTRFEREFRIGDTGNTVDFFVDGKIILEFKAKRFLTPADFTQVQRYLQATDVKLGILVNFGPRYVQTERVVLIGRTTRNSEAFIRSHSQN